VKPTSSAKCPSLKLSAPPPAQCTMAASRMMARTTMTTQKKNTMIPGMAYPATVLLAMAVSYPAAEASFQPIARGREAGRYPPTSTRAPPKRGGDTLHGAPRQRARACGIARLDQVRDCGGHRPGTLRVLPAPAVRMMPPIPSQPVDQRPDIGNLHVGYGPINATAVLKGEGPGDDAGVRGPACGGCGHVDRLIT